MNLFKTNKVIQLMTALVIIILSHLRIVHFIEQTAFLWIAFGSTFIALMASQRVVEKLKKKVDALEEE